MATVIAMDMAIVTGTPTSIRTDTATRTKGLASAASTVQMWFRTTSVSTTITTVMIMTTTSMRAMIITTTTTTTVISVQEAACEVSKCEGGTNTVTGATDLEHGRHEHDCDDHSHLATESSVEVRHRHFEFENLNIQAAFIHVIGDFVQSVGVCIAGGLIWYDPSWQIADPIATFLFSVLVLIMTVNIAKESVHVLMEGTPRGIYPDKIEHGLGACESVVAIHDLHIWSLSSSKPALSVHLVANNTEAALRSAQSFLISSGITHTTIQIERADCQYPQDCGKNIDCVKVAAA